MWVCLGWGGGGGFLSSPKPWGEATGYFKKKVKNLDRLPGNEEG